MFSLLSALQAQAHIYNHRPQASGESTYKLVYHAAQEAMDVTFCDTIPSQSEYLLDLYDFGKSVYYGDVDSFAARAAVVKKITISRLSLSQKEVETVLRHRWQMPTELHLSNAALQAAGEAFVAPINTIAFHDGYSFEHSDIHLQGIDTIRIEARYTPMLLRSLRRKLKICSSSQIQIHLTVRSAWQKQRARHALQKTLPLAHISTRYPVKRAYR